MRKKFIISFIASLFFCVLSKAQQAHWVFRGGSPYNDNISNMVIDSKKNIIISGSYETIAKYDQFVITGGNNFVFKADSNHYGLWIKNFYPSTVKINKIVSDQDDNYLILGTMKDSLVCNDSLLMLRSSATDDAKFLIKLKTDGQIDWIKKIAEPVYANYSDLVDIINVTDGYVLSGYYFDTLLVAQDTLVSLMNTNQVLIKFNTNGNLNWYHEFDFVGSGASFGESEYMLQIKTDNNGNLYSLSYFTFNSNYAILKFDNNGAFADTLFLLENHSGFGINTDVFFSIDQYENVIVAGWYVTSVTVNGVNLNFNSTGHMFLIKYLQATNSIEWAVGFGNNLEEYHPRLLICGDDGQFYITGFSAHPFTGNYQFSFIKRFNPSGVETWEKRPTGNSQCFPLFLNADANSDFFLGGVYYIRYPNQIPGTLIFDSDSVNTFSQNNSGDVFIAKFSSNPLPPENNENEPSDSTLGYNNIFVYPVPFSYSTTVYFPSSVTSKKNISLKIYDCLGREVTDNARFNLVETEEGGNKILLNRGNLNNGIYFISVLQENNTIYIGKLLIQ